MSRPLLRLSTALHPSAEQAAILEFLLQAATGLEAALRHAQGDWGALPGDLHRAAMGETLPPRSPSTPVPTDLVARLRATLPEPWATLPPPLLRGVIAQATRPPGQAGVPLDGAILAVDDLHVHIEGMPELLLADLWRLPLGLTGVLLADGHAQLARVHGWIREAEAADRAGERRGPRRLRALAGQYGPLWARTLPAPLPDVPDVQRVHATLRPYRPPGGEPGWTVTWGLRVHDPAWLPPASRADTVGVDVGVQRLITWASATETASINAPIQPPGAPGPTGGPAGLLVDAILRRAHFQRRATDLDRALRAILAYRDIAVEDAHWHDLAGTPELQEMMLSGVTELPHWLRELSRVTGSRTRGVSAWHGSHRCGGCGRPGEREGPRFTCVACGVSDADANAARWYRRLGLRT